MEEAIWIPISLQQKLCGHMSSRQESQNQNPPPAAAAAAPASPINQENGVKGPHITIRHHMHWTWLK